MTLPILELTIEQRREIFNQVSIEQNIPVQAVEKDWWVSVTLRAVFASPHAPHLLFKGGTSLSKGWGLIQRFSEDIDLAVDRARWGYDDTISNSQITKLRQKSRAFVRGELAPAIAGTFAAWGIEMAAITMIVVEKEDAEGKIIQDQDPTEVNISYTSLFEPHPYLKATVKIEVSARSMHDPADTCVITSFVDAFYHEMPFALPSFEVLTVRPTRTFLEKAILLHEGFVKPFSPEKAERKSRHLYDLVQLMDTEHGTAAVIDKELFAAIIAHRLKFTREKGVDYENISRATLSFIPPEETHEFWESDYRAMIESMIQGKAPTFEELMTSLATLQERFKV